jgi:hypothetical protein
MRDTTGRFLPGKSGNPGGRPRVVGHIRDLAQCHAEAAIQTLAEIMSVADAPASSRIAASVALLDRGYGRPVDQKAMVLLAHNVNHLRALHELPTDVLLAELTRLQDGGIISGEVLSVDDG